MKWQEDGSDKWHASMAGIECVFAKEKENVFVITVYMEAGKK